MTAPVVMLVAAEASGDVLGAGLARALRQILPDVRLVGVGGPKMAVEGIDSPFDINELSIVGLVEGLLAYPKVKARVKDVVALAKRARPKVAVLIDSFGFTIRVAQALRAADPDIVLIKYVGPQVWASRPKRAKALAQVFDHLLAILPFDAPFYEPYGFPVDFVGNPSLATDFSGADPRRTREAIGAAPDDPILLLLPGSRPGEIARMLPPFEEAVKILKADRPKLHIVVAVADTIAEVAKPQLAGWSNRVHIVEGEAAKRDAMKAATVALACSGTVTTELALAGAPMVVGYRMGRLTHAILKRLIRTPFVVLFNIAGQAFIAPELIQDDCTGPKLAEALAARLDDPILRASQVEAQNAALEAMGRGEPDPAAKAAAIVARYAEANSRSDPAKPA